MILPFDKISRNDTDKAGGKGASLGEMTRAGIAIPPGFVVLAETFEEFIDSNNLRAEIQTILESLDHNNVGSIEHASEKIQELIRGGIISEKTQKEVQKHNKAIKTDFVAVRSSATAEDGAEHAWAGQLDTYLNVPKTDIITKIQSCWASLFTPRALFYRSEKGLQDLHISVAVVVQSMVDAESAGVAFSVHPVTENTDEIVIEGSWGLGEAVVSGEVTPDSFVISKSSGEIISEHIAEKKKGIFRNTNGENEWRTIEKHEQEKSILSGKELSELARLIIKIENHYGFPCDIEWAHSKGEIYILQARPITTLKNTKKMIKGIFDDDWQLTSTRNMPLWHNILCVYGWENNMVDYGVNEKLRCIFAIENATHATMFTQSENQKNYFEATVRRCSNGKEVRKLQKIYEKYAQEVQESLKTIIKKPNKKNLDKFFSDYQRFTAGLWITTGFGRIGLEKLMQELRDTGIVEANLAEIVSMITYPEEHTPLFKSQEDMIEIGIKVQKGKEKNTEKEIKKWLEKHKYIPVNYCDNPWSEDDARDQLESILEQDCEKLKKTFTENHKQKIQARNALRKKFNKKIRDLSDALAEATSLNEYRKNIFCRLSHDIRFFFEPLMQKIGRTDWRDAYYCTPEEISTIVEGSKIDIDKIKQEREKSVFVLENDKILWADESQKEYFFNKIYKKNSLNGDGTITGFSANRGKITGTVKIILSSRDFHKVSRGDILVTTMTSVDFVPVMERAGAFVTNEGGITTHAAIVSREMNKPCIVGTKNATQILKDGDLVEVDAENGIVKILEKHDDEWIKNVTREVTIFPAASVTKSFGKISKPFEIEFDYEHILFVGNTWYYRKSDYEKLKDILTRKIQDNPNYIFDIAIRQKKVGENLKKFVKKLASVQISNKNLESLVREYDEKMTEFYAFWWIAIPVGEILEGQVRRILQKQSEIDFDELMFVREELELVREKRLRNAIGIECQKYKKYEDLPETIKKKLIQHAEQFGWINTSYHVGIGLSARDFFEKIKTENPQESIQEMKKQREADKNTLIKIKKYASIEDQSIIESMQAIMYLRNYQKETVNECQYKSEIFLRKIANKTKLEWDTFLAFSATEIQQYIGNKLLKEEYIKKAKKRHKEFVIEWVVRNVSVYEEHLGKYQEKVAKNEPDKVKIIQGNPAYKGKITGTVRVIHKKSDIDLFIPGEILVTNMTSIDYVHIMGRASAIITNEGGITCHAAIFSRELKIPCIIGTKNATQVLKNGDVVEVDADNGVVNIINTQTSKRPLFSEIITEKQDYIKVVTRPYPLLLLSVLWEGSVEECNSRKYYKNIGANHSAFSVGPDLYYLSADIDRFEKELLEFYIKESSFLSIQKKWENAEKNLIHAAKSTNYVLYIKYIKEYSPGLNVVYIQNALFVLLHGLLVEKSNEKTANKLMDIINLPLKLNYHRQEEYDLVVTNDIINHVNQYGWLFSKYGSHEPYTLEQATKRKKNIDTTMYLKHFDEQKQKVENAISKAKKILGTENRYLIDLMQWLVWFRTQRTDVIAQATYLFHPGYKKLAQEFNITYEELLYMSTEETIQKKTPSRATLQERKRGYAFYIDKNQQHIFTRDEYSQAQKFMGEKIQFDTQIVGKSACAGYIKGIVKIVHNKEDLLKVNTGDIIVTTMTTPNMISAMKCAAAFITDEGGITCHAAIISRELKKPCIIGTKIATKILKDGDIVEIDADNGVIKVLDKKDNYFDDKKLLSEGGRACYLYPNRIFCTRMNIPHPLWENHLMVISTSENHKVNWYFAVKDESEFNYTLERVLAKKGMLQEGEKQINKLVQKAEKTLKKEYKNQKEAGKGYESFIKIYEEIAIVPTFVRQLDRAVVRSLREVITNEEDFAVATYPTKRTYQRQEEVLLLELRTKMGEKITPDVQQNLHEIYSIYFTSGLGYFEEQVKTMENYEERLLGISKEEARESLKKIQTEEKEMIKKKKELKKNFPKKADVIDIAGFLVYLKDHYKFQINKVQHSSEGLWKSMADITGYAENFLRDLTPEEIQNLIQNNTIDEEAIKELIACHAYIYNEKGEPELIIGKKAQDFIQKYLKTNNEQKEFSGRIACKGHGTGRAKIILGTRDFHKMEQGDILIVMNTSPDFVPIMKKAAAIVAEEGGITGHVSVVSREFGIPSVVGIKQITSIIKDGEMIEVDAERGIVIRHNN